MVEAAVFEGLSWNLPDDVTRMLAYPFMVNAVEAGTAVAVMGGATGWFMALRRQAFSGHTLSAIAFPGAAAAALAGLPAAIGAFGFCGAGALVLARIEGPGDRTAGASAATGTLQAFALGLGFLFAGLYHGLLSGLDALLFGTFLGIARAQVVALLVVAGTVLAALAAAARPLLFASVDPDVARARGVQVDRLAAGFLLLLGLAVAETSQITGALLVFSLLVTPAATAQLLTARPWLGAGLSVALALGVTWLGLGLAYFSIYPVGFYVTSLSFGLYVLARALDARRRR